MRRNTLLLRLMAAVFALALLGAACGGDSDSNPSAGDASSEDSDAGSSMDDGSNSESITAGAIDTPAAELAQGLTDLLDSHVYLAGIAVEQAALTKDPNSAQFKAAAGTLDKNSQDLAAAIESVYGPEAGDQFLKLWRAHIGMFVDYTVGGITGDAKAQAAAKKELDKYRQDFGAFIDGATNGELPKAAVADALQMHVDSLIITIDLVLSGEGNPFLSLYDSASDHMPMTASALATGIATSQGIEGQVDSAPAKLQQDLTDLLVSHVFLAGITVEQAALTKDPESAQFKAAAAALDQNSQDLAAAIESVYGPEAGDQFLELWRAHIGMFVDYTIGGLTGDTAMQKKAGKELDKYRQDFGAFIDGATNGELPKAAVADALQMHVDSLVLAVDSIVEGKGNPFELLYAASHEHMPMTASALAGGIVASNPDKF